MSDALDIGALLTELGFDTADSAARARAVLEEEHLTRPGKTRIDAAKRPRIEEALATRFLVTCGAPECARGAGMREVAIAASLARCSVCHGSANRRSITEAQTTLRKAGISRILVVGGSPALHEELRRTAPADWELRLVDGTARRTGDAARSDLKWAQLVLIWGATELDHKVSTLYTDPRDGGRKDLVIVNRRGIAALFEAASKHASSRSR